MSESMQEWLALTIVGINCLVLFGWWLRKRRMPHHSAKKGCTTCASNTSCSANADNKNTTQTGRASTHELANVIIVKKTDGLSK